MELEERLAAADLSGAAIDESTKETEMATQDTASSSSTVAEPTAGPAAVLLDNIPTQVVNQQLLIPIVVQRSLRGVPLSLPARWDDITQVSLCSAQLREVPAALLSGAANNIQKLDLSRNFLKKLPVAGWSTLAALEELDLSHNQIKDLPASLCTARCIKRLILRSNCLRNWTSGCLPVLRGFEALDHLDLRCPSSTHEPRPCT